MLLPQSYESAQGVMIRSKNCIQKEVMTGQNTLRSYCGLRRSDKIWSVDRRGHCRQAPDRALR